MKHVLIAIVLVLGLVGCAARATYKSTPIEAETTPAQVAQETTTAPAGASSWSSEAEYVADLLDSNDKITQLLDTYALAATSVGTGGITLGQFQSLSGTFSEVMDSHISYFAGRTAPERFRPAHDEWLRGIKHCRDAGNMASIATSASAIISAADKLAQCGDTIAHAATLLPAN